MKEDLSLKDETIN
jgi:hypothetical protein